MERLSPPRLISLAVAIGLAVGGCALFPLPAPPSVDVPQEIVCPPERMPAGGLGCLEAIRAAVDALPDPHAAVLRAEFVYGPCDCPDGALCDCAIHHLGTVTLSFPEGRPPVAVRVVRAGGVPAARIEAPPTIPGR